MKNRKNITIGVLVALCLTLLITTLAYAQSASRAEAELDEQETRLIEWYKGVVPATIDYNLDIIEGLNAKIATMEQERVDTYNASLEAFNAYTASYNGLLESRNQLVAELAKQRMSYYPVEKIVYEDRVIREFESSGQLAEWARNTITYLMPSGVYEVDCDDYATRLQRKAMQEGYKLSVQLIEDGKLLEVDVSSQPDIHMGNLAIIGNSIYYVEPLPGDNFTVIKVCNRD